MSTNMPPNRTKPCPLTRRQLGAMFYEGNSLAQMGRHFDCSTPTVRLWLARFQIDRTKRYVDMEQERDAVMNADGTIQWLDMPSDNQQPNLELPSLIPESTVIEDEEEAGAWRLMTAAQRKAIIMIGGSQTDEVTLQNEDIAKELGLQTQTIRLWRKDPNFQAALRQYSEPEAKSELFQMYKRELLLQYMKSPDKVNKDVRESAERFLGIGGKDTQINIGIAFKTPETLKNVF